MYHRREKGLCYNCEEVYTFGHKCKSKQLFVLYTDSTDDRMPSDISSKLASPTPERKDDIAISLNALSGNHSFQTLKLQGKVKNCPIMIIIDSSSTHNFMDITTARSLGCVVRPTQAHEVSVTGGGSLSCDSLCFAFSWSVQGVLFTLDV